MYHFQVLFNITLEKIHFELITKNCPQYISEIEGLTFSAACRPICDLIQFTALWEKRHVDSQLSRRDETTSFIYNENNNSIRHLRHRAKCSGWSGSASTCPSSSKHAPLQGHRIHIQAVISANDSRYSFHQEIVLLSQYSVLALFQYSY